MQAEFKRVLETLGVQLTEADLRALIHRQKEREGVGARSSHGRGPPRRLKQSGPKPAMNTREFCTDTPLNWLPPASDVEVYVPQAAAAAPHEQALLIYSACCWSRWRDDMRKHRLVTSKVISPGHEMLVSARDRSESRASAVSSRTALSSVVPFRRGAADLMRGDRSVDSRASVRDGREIANRVLRSRTRRRDGRSNQRGPGGDGGSVVGGDAARGDSAIDYYNFVVNTVGQPGCSRRGVAVGQASQRLRAPSVSSRRSEDLSMEDLRRALVVAQRAADALRKRASGAAPGAASKGGSQTRGAESVGARVPVPPSTARSARSRSSGRHASQGPATPRDAAMTARTIKHAIEILATARAASRSQA